MGQFPGNRLSMDVRRALRLFDAKPPAPPRASRIYAGSSKSGSTAESPLVLQLWVGLSRQFPVPRQFEAQH